MERQYDEYPTGNGDGYGCHYAVVGQRFSLEQVLAREWSKQCPGLRMLIDSPAGFSLVAEEGSIENQSVIEKILQHLQAKFALPPAPDLLATSLPVILIV